MTKATYNGTRGDALRIYDAQPGEFVTFKKGETQEASPELVRYLKLYMPDAFTIEGDEPQDEAKPERARRRGKEKQNEGP